MAFSPAVARRRCCLRKATTAEGDEAERADVSSTIPGDCFATKTAALPRLADLGFVAVRQGGSRPPRSPSRLPAHAGPDNAKPSAQGAPPRPVARGRT
jgi:hypothetical protein